MDVKADICEEGLGICNQCDERCKAKHGPTAESSCDRYQLCTCRYTCGPPSPSPPSKQCTGGAGFCSTTCGNQCCNQSCAQKYPGGVGFCENLDHSLLCKCQYPC
ncbi:unnamed protein product [Thlaspi arvense]|uniref:Defensin-like protein n=1 Tax=Thlaspi arvense TaxID=13288 RepID=A0AAU9T554_THLAR|nr:unnamed protein product [Thlaspi arvense]